MVIAFDIGGSKIAAARVGADLTAVEIGRLPTPVHDYAAFCAAIGKLAGPGDEPVVARGGRRERRGERTGGHDEDDRDGDASYAGRVAPVRPRLGACPGTPASPRSASGPPARQRRHRRDCPSPLAAAPLRSAPARPRCRATTPFTTREAQ